MNVRRKARSDYIRWAICKILATSNKPLTLNEILEKLQLEFNIHLFPRTVRYHLDFLIKIGRVHMKKIGGITYFEWNGFREFQERIYISENHMLFLDVLISKNNKVYIRIKERKQGIDLGAIIIPLEFVDEILNKLKELSRNAQKLDRQLTEEKIKKDIEGYLKEELEQ